MQLSAGLALIGLALFDWQPVLRCATATQCCAKKTREGLLGLLGSRGGMNWPVYMQRFRTSLVRFRSFELARRLHRACPALLRQLFGPLLGGINRQIVCKDFPDSEIVSGYWTWLDG